MGSAFVISILSFADSFENLLETEGLTTESRDDGRCFHDNVLDNGVALLSIAEFVKGGDFFFGGISGLDASVLCDSISELRGEKDNDGRSSTGGSIDCDLECEGESLSGMEPSSGVGESLMGEIDRARSISVQKREKK